MVWEFKVPWGLIANRRAPPIFHSIFLPILDELIRGNIKIQRPKVLQLWFASSYTFFHSSKLILVSSAASIDELLALPALCVIVIHSEESRAMHMDICHRVLETKPRSFSVGRPLTLLPRLRLLLLLTLLPGLLI